MQNAKSLIIMGILYIVSALMLGSHLFIGSGIICFIAIVLRILCATDKIKPITIFVVRILSFIGIILLIIQGFISHNIANSFINLLLLGCALKFLEYQKRRDLFVQCSALFFLSAIPLIFHFQIYIVLYMIFIISMTIWCLIANTHNDSVINDIKLIMKLLIPAIPLTLVLFIVFPRFGSLWVLNTNNTEATTGVSDEMSANEIANLSQSSKIVARAIFHSEIPKIRYFNAVTYEKLRYNKWNRGDKFRQRSLNINWFRYTLHQQPFPNTNNINFSNDYDLMLEPTGTIYVPTLKYSSTNEKDLFYFENGYYTTAIPAPSRAIYHFTYFTEQDIERHNREFLRRENARFLNENLSELTEYHPRRNLKTQEFVKNLTQNLSSDQEKANAIYNYFKEGFTYTLNPGRYENHELDELLFERKQGFCSHFASAMAQMLRMAKIPSRVIGGYLGGEVRDNYVIIREYDAHAWVEAYINNKWVRYDPTLLVSPSRLENIVISGSNNDEDAIYLQQNNFFKFVRNAFEFIDYKWSSWFLNFDQQSQDQLFNKNLILIVLIIISGFVGCGLVLYIQNQRRNHKKQDKEVMLLEKALNMLTRISLTINEGETLEDFKDSIMASNISNDLKQNIANIIDIYSKIRYQPISDHEKQEFLITLETNVNNLKLKI